MRTALGKIACLLLAPTLAIGCVAPAPIDDPASDGGDNGGENTTIPGDQIAEDATWSGTVSLDADAVIKPGVTITVLAGTRIEQAQGKFITVQGTLNIEGTAASKVLLVPPAGGGGFGGIKVASGGALVMRHLDAQTGAMLVSCESGAVSCDIEHSTATDMDKAFNFLSPGTLDHVTVRNTGNGGLTVGAGADVSVVDSVFEVSQHDIIIQTGGKLAIDHSRIGDTGYIHCGVHLSGAESFSITNSVIQNNEYGFMLYGGGNHVITGNNFVGNKIDHISFTNGVSATASGNYWASIGGTSGAPDQAGVTVSGNAGSAIAAAGPRP